MLHTVITRYRAPATAAVSNDSASLVTTQMMAHHALLVFLDVYLQSIIPWFVDESRLLPLEYSEFVLRTSSGARDTRYKSSSAEQ